jgi:hypothetical protein
VYRTRGYVWHEPGRRRSVIIKERRPGVAVTGETRTRTTVGRRPSGEMGIRGGSESRQTTTGTRSERSTTGMGTQRGRSERSTTGMGAPRGGGAGHGQPGRQPGGGGGSSGGGSPSGGSPGGGAGGY